VKKILFVAFVVSAFACKSPGEAIAEAVAEAAAEAATGGKVDIKDGKITVKGEDGEVATITTDKEGEEGSVRITNNKGETAQFGVGATLPEGFPLPLIDGAKIVSSTKSEGEEATFHIIAEVNKSPKDIADFYVEELKNKGFNKVQRTAHDMGTGSMVSLTTNKEKTQVAVTIVHENKEEKSVMTIMWTAK